MTSRIESTGPLAGLRVLELTSEHAQFCGKLMADLGADVIKIEPPGGQETRTSDRSWTTKLTRSEVYISGITTHLNVGLLST